MLCTCFTSTVYVPLVMIHVHVFPSPIGSLIIAKVGAFHAAWGELPSHSNSFNQICRYWQQSPSRTFPVYIRVCMQNACEIAAVAEISCISNSCEAKKEESKKRSCGRSLKDMVKPGEILSGQLIKSPRYAISSIIVERFSMRCSAPSSQD